MDIGLSPLEATGRRSFRCYKQGFIMMSSGYSQKGIVLFSSIGLTSILRLQTALSADDHRDIQHELTKLYDNMSMSMAIGAGITAFEANLNAYRERKEGSKMLRAIPEFLVADIMQT